METLGKSHRQIITFNNEIGYSYVPNLKARLINSEGGYFIRTNSQGFRSNIEYMISYNVEIITNGNGTLTKYDEPIAKKIRDNFFKIFLYIYNIF